VDDLIDGEWDDGVANSPRALNGSLALSFLAMRCLGPIEQHIDLRRAWLIRDLVARSVVAACAGEDLDLLFEASADLDEQRALEMTRRKSGSLVAMACRVGAAVATDDLSVLSLVGIFGEHVGVVAQLLNDMGGIEPNSLNRGTDLQRRKKTLPVAYALRCAREEGIGDVLDWYQDPSAAGGLDQQAEREEALAHRMADLGALHYTWIVADAHRRDALTCVRRLECSTGLASVRHLRRLVPSLRARRPRENVS
jgi:geranylgeranyl pyrophosphate synthase